MKAEQRKELETNTLADKMGHVVTSMKGGSRRTVLIYAGLAALLVVAAWVGYRMYQGSKEEASMRWVYLYDGAQPKIDALATMENEQGKAARFQRAWLFYWEAGVKNLGRDQAGAVSALKGAEKEYSELMTLCKDDPVYEPQAMLGRAVAIETLAVQDRANLDRAAKAYQEILEIHDKKYENYAEGKFAKSRLEYVSAKDEKGQANPKHVSLRESYQKLSQMLGVFPDLGKLPGGFEHPPIDGKGKEKDKGK